MREKNVIVNVKFDTPLDSTYYVLMATGEQNKINISNGTLNLMKGRIYYIPINNTTADSDEYEVIKVLSQISDKIDIRYIKEGYACVIPLVHNFQIKNSQQLCILY